MPVVLPRHMEDLWLETAPSTTPRRAPATWPHIPTTRWEAYEVSTLVNSAGNEGPEVIRAPYLIL